MKHPICAASQKGDCIKNGACINECWYATEYGKAFAAGPRPKSPLTLFDEATRKVTEDRGAVYGHPLDDFAKVNKMAEAIADCPDLPIRHALYMILVKVARLAKSPDHLDSLIDIAGYARTAAMILDKRLEKAPTPELKGKRPAPWKCNNCGEGIETWHQKKLAGSRQLLDGTAEVFYVHQDCKQPTLGKNV